MSSETSTSTEYCAPQKEIITPKQLEQFQQSETHSRILAYIQRLNEAVVGVKLRDPCHESEAVQAILGALDSVAQIAKETPPVDNAGSRFGNPAFKTFYDKVKESSHELQKSIPGLPEKALVETSSYFEEAWGNRTRIDYGSGMELNFLCWLLCMDHFAVLKTEDDVAVVTRIFWRYIEVMRILQSAYWLEPAALMVYGDWTIITFYRSCSVVRNLENLGHKHLRPKSIHDKEILEEFAPDYMYLACIQFINSIKTASLRWHSPMLDDISAVKTWDKVNAGMVKMYLAEVLGKLPVVQHFLFGSILPYTGERIVQKEEDKDDPHSGHSHDLGGAGQTATGWGDCCGIPVPSAFGAAAAAGKGAVGRPCDTPSTLD